MTDKLFCPFCQQELFYTYQQDGIVPNPNKGKVDGVFCDNCKMYGNETIWERLDHTRKALDVAKEGLKSAHDYYEYCIQRDKDCDSDDINWDCTALNMDNDISEALEQIIALEQKEEK